MSTISIPASIEDATNRLGAVERLLTAQSWERAAIVAAFVQPQANPGGDPATNAESRIGRMSPQQFAELGIVGLCDRDTVRLYAQRWLDAHDGIHPEPGAAVELPDLGWPPQDRNRGGRVSTDPVRAVEQIVEAHGAEAVAEAISETAPDVATRVRPPRTIVDDFHDDARDFADNMRNRTRSTLAGGVTSRAAQEVTFAAQRIAGARLTADIDQDRGEELITAVNHLRAFLESWHGFLTGHTTAWTNDDRAFAEELGINLEVH